MRRCRRKPGMMSASVTCGGRRTACPTSSNTEVTLMALLTAEDVLNRKFQATKFREGYDQDEVDDFLDEVVNTLRALATESDDLKGKLATAERRIAELSRASASAAAVARLSSAIRLSLIHI